MQVWAIIVSDESVREARIVREARAAAAEAAELGQDDDFPKGFAEDVFIAQLHNRAALLSGGFQVPLGPTRDGGCDVHTPKLSNVLSQLLAISTSRNLVAFVDFMVLYWWLHVCCRNGSNFLRFHSMRCFA